MMRLCRRLVGGVQSVLSPPLRFDYFHAVAKPVEKIAGIAFVKRQH
jgi:hypothetical protein